MTHCVKSLLTHCVMGTRLRVRLREGRIETGPPHLEDLGMTAIFDRLSDTRKEWFQKGNEIWSDFQTKHNDWLVDLNSRRDRLIERSQEVISVGQKALSTFERSALERAAEFLTWAYTTTGERSDAIQRSVDFLKERLEDVEEFDATEEPFEGYDDLNVKQIAAKLEEASKRELLWVSAYEAGNKNRKTVLDTAKRLLTDD